MKPAWLNDVANIYAESGLTTFQKILLIKTLRPDYLHTALCKLAAEVLGKPIFDTLRYLWSSKSL